MRTGSRLLLVLLVWGSAAARDGDLTVRPTCKPGFSEEDYTAFVSQSIMEGQKLLKGLDLEEVSDLMEKRMKQHRQQFRAFLM